jgi:FemAB-related protein (PEP-CTERM system-associated)
MITIARESGAALWDEYVHRTPAATVYHLFAWRRVIEKTFGHRAVYLSALDGDQIVGLLPLIEMRSRLFGHMLVSLPFFNYGGICSTREDVRLALLEAAVGVARERRADAVELRQEDDWDLGLPRKAAKVAMRRQLPPTADELWKALGSKLRNQVQRPRKEGMTAVVGRQDQLDAFYDVFATNMRDLGTPVYPKTLFANILEDFPDRTWIGAVYAGRTPVAAGFLVGFKDRLEIPWASSLGAYNRFSPNMLLYWSVLEFACSNGYREFDFGRSTPGEGTFKFKEQWGARPTPLYWYYWLPNGADMPQVNPKNPKYKAAIALWQRMPLGLTRLIGPRIVKYIP